MRTLPYLDAQHVLNRLRSGTDITTILDHVKAGNILIQMAVAPETRFRYSFPYRSEMPDEYYPNNPYLNSMIYEVASLHAADPPSQSAEQRIPSSLEALGSSEYQSLYLKPFHAAMTVEPRLSDVKVSLWTTVCSDDTLMRQLLAALFRCEYQFTAAFHKDLFLEDMAAQRSDFCSPLLVNIVLAYSCVCHPSLRDRAEYWNPRTLTYRFCAEARRIWEFEAGEPRITTIQAGILFSVFYNLCGLDEIGQSYRIHAVALARELRLFERDAHNDSDRIRNGKAFAAWALYNWETLVAFSFVHSPLLKEPPDWQLPDPSKDSTWFGEIWVRYPLARTPSPVYFGHVLKARSQFRVVMNEFCQVAYSDDSTVTLEKAHGLLDKLQSWYDGLSTPLLPRTIVLPGHLQLHMYYHHLILTLFEPLLEDKTDKKPHPRQVVNESRRRLQTLIRLYYLRHGFEAMDLFIVIPLMLAACDCVDAIDQDTPAAQLEGLRSTLILVAQGLYSQRRNHYLAEALFRVVRGRMRPQEVALLRETVTPDEEDAEGKRKMMQAVRSHWPVSVVKKREDMDTQILGNLVESYAHLNADDSE
ncbi:hypothetical protein HIM_01299 [Hirsutella minnesotensis 3608]|nr:hypothetical protein HIM_01299 [Hirsutella minnesotensis 3608]